MFTNGSTLSKPQLTPSTSATPPQNPSRVDVHASNNVAVTKDKNRREPENTDTSNYIKLIGSTKELNQHGTFFRQEGAQIHSYIQMRQGDSLCLGKTYCIIFYYQEKHRIQIPFPIMAKYISSWGSWEVWTFDMPKCINRTIRRWSIRVGYPVEIIK